MTPRPRVTLSGLHPRPLATYLAALGVLRICSRQHSPNTLGAFGEQGFVLEGVEERELLELLLERWVPTPILTPWNNASGFYESSKGRPAASAMSSLSRSKLARLGPLLRAIEDVRNVIAIAGYSSAPKDEEKARFMSRLRGILPDDAVAWLDAVGAVDADDARMMPLLGSGGNEGVLDYSGLYLRSLVETLLSDRSHSERLLASVLFGRITTGLLERPGGQFDPGTAGGYNTGPGFESKDLPNNPWAFLLLVEGSVAWASGLSARQQGAGSGYRFAVSPFTVRHRAAGYGSAGHVDEDPQRVRAEVWVPVWRRLATYAEVGSFIAEGRVEIARSGDKPGRAVDSLDFVNAVASLGVDRGVDSFVRYAIVKRRGESFVALPASTLDVRHRRAADLLQELDSQLELLDRFLSRFPSEQGPPAVLAGLRRRVDDARFDAAVHGEPDALVRLVRALGALEMFLSKRDPSKEPRLVRPLGGLSEEWIEACGDSVEVRVAAALASVEQTGGAGALRSYLAPLDPNDPRAYAPAARVTAWAGADFTDRLASVLQRRLLDVAKKRGHVRGDGAPRNPTFGIRTASLDDVAVFMADGLVDLGALEELMFGFTWVRHRSPAPRPRVRRVAPPLPRSYALLKLLFLPRGVPADRAREPNVFCPPDPAIVSLLRVGRVSDAVAIGRRQLSRLFAPRRVVDQSVGDAAFGRRLAAALLIPVSESDRLLEVATIPRTRDDEDEEMIDGR
jgi:CRISPR-associated protein Csx17